MNNDVHMLVTSDNVDGMYDPDQIGDYGQEMADHIAEMEEL